MNTDEAKAEARAQIIWGEPRESVQALLRINGFSEPEASALLMDFHRERITFIHGSGLKKVLIGLLLIPVPAIAYLIFVMIEVMLIKLFAIACLIGVFGLWKVISGLLLLIKPDDEHGDFSALTD